MKWLTVKLGDITEVVMGQAPNGSTYNEEKIGYPLIAGAGDFADGVVSVGKYTTEPTKISQQDDIVISIRASIGEKVWAESGYCLGRGVAAIRTTEKIDKNYLWHALSYVEPMLVAKGRGATFLQVNKEDIQNLEVPLPPFAEQQRIAAQLDTADRILRLREQAIARLDQLAQSVFVEMFENSESKKLPVYKLQEICEFKYGKSLPAQNRVGGNVEVYGSNGVVGYHNQSLTTGSTIIIGRKGSLGEINRSDSSCYPIDTTFYVDKTATSQNLTWLEFALVRLGLNKMNKAAAVPGLSREDAYRQKILVPPSELQLKFEKNIEEVKRYSRINKFFSKKAEQLSASLQYQYFS
jgi:type I restriction enzyme S subunit